jgi:Protein of unknown function (DUF2637)
MTGDRAIRASTAAVVTAVATFAAIVSYSHIYDLGRGHGQAGTAARLLPLSVDGLILAASLVMLHEARNRRPAPLLARVALWLGIAATLGANAAYGAPYGPLGVVVSTWPAVSFVLSVEVALGLVRRARTAGTQNVRAAVDTPGPAALAPAVPAAVPIPTHRQVRADYACGPATAKKIRAGMVAAVKATQNGHTAG